MSSFLLTGADGIFTGLPGDAMRASGSIRVRDGVIMEIGALDAQPGERVIDVAGCVIYPGLISTHHHLFQSVLKGVRSGLDAGLFQWLRSVPYTYWHKIDEEALAIAARIGLAELILSGTTTAADHHYLFAQSYRFDPAHVIFQVAREMGLRFVFCRGGATTGRSFDTDEFVPMPTEPMDQMLASVQACANRYHDASANSLSRVAFPPTTPTYSVDVAQLKALAAAARNMGLRIHSHLSETSDYVSFCMEKFGKRPVHWMADHDWLGPDVWFAHLVHIDEAEVRMLVETGTGMAHCPQSNCRLGSGVAPAEMMAALGGAVSLAVDGAASNESADMLSEMHSAWHTHRAIKSAGSVSAEEIVRWSTAGGARVLGFEKTGTIAPGMLADIAVFDLAEPRYFGLHDPLSGPVIGAGSGRVKHLFVGGKSIVESGAIPGLDLARLRHDARHLVQRLVA